MITKFAKNSEVKMIVEEKHVPYIKVGDKYIVNYELFLHKLGNMEG